MLYNELSMHHRYDLSSPAFEAAFSFLRRSDLTELDEGEYPVYPGVTAYVQRYTTSPAEALDFETHNKYFDIQYVVSGLEAIGVIPRRCLSEQTPYDSARDIQYWHEPDFAGSVVLYPGDYAVLPPEMAHKPRISLGEDRPVRKVVIKVPAVPR